jgi:hypothetical protein
MDGTGPRPTNSCPPFVASRTEGYADFNRQSGKSFHEKAGQCQSPHWFCLSTRLSPAKLPQSPPFRPHNRAMADVIRR